jgi:DNA-binding MarR family transcriptional regulator
MADTHDGPLIAALLRAPYQAAMTHLQRRLSVEFPDLRPAHMVVLHNLGLPPNGSRLTDLAERAQITVQSMGELIDTLERTGYVERIPEPADRRAKRIRYTARGRAVHDRGGEAMLELQQSWAQRLGAARFEHLLRLLRELNDRVLADGEGA